MLSSRIPYALMLELEQLYPPKCLRAGDNVEEHREYAGKVALVEWLRAHFNQQSPDVPVEAPAHVDPETGVRTYDELYGGLED